jgi:hypothetical protein
VTKLGILVLLFATLPVSAFACRTPYQTHSQRLGASDLAAVARVSGIRSAALEADTYVDAEKFPIIFESERTIRLVVIQRLKGDPPKLIEITIDHCQGSLSAEFGGLVAAYRIDGQWRLDHWPTKDRVIKFKPSPPHARP